MLLVSTGDSPSLPRSVGRYLLYDEIAAGGMATVHVGRLLGPAGFSRTVAVKRLHPQFAKDPEFVSMFLDEARLAARIRHPNVVSTLDVVAREGELFLVMEYVQGLSLSRLVVAAHYAGQAMPPRVASAILGDTLLGLNAAHEAKNDRGEPLGIVHRDISPQNIIVGADGIARVVDFGVAKAASRAQTTKDGQIKGKLAYMSPEQVQSKPVDRRSDVFAASVVLWELLAGRRLFAANDPGGTVANILWNPIEPPSKFAPGIGSELDRVALRGLARNPSERFSTTREMAQALEGATPRAGSLEVADWVAQVAGELLQTSADRVALIEEASSEAELPPSMVPPSIRQMGVASVSGNRHLAPALPSRRQSDASLGNQDTLPEVTDLSASHASPVPSTPPWKSSRVRGMTAAAVLSIITLGALAAGHETNPPVAAPASFEATSSEARDPATFTAAAQPTAMPSLTASRATSVNSLPLVDTPSPNTQGAATTTPKAVTTTPKARPRSGTLPRRSCNPPFTLRPDGSKRFKPECF
jgi:eukaryotic-like serine/threonine-protein kinase